MRQSRSNLNILKSTRAQKFNKGASNFKIAKTVTNRQFESPLTNNKNFLMNLITSELAKKLSNNKVTNSTINTKIENSCGKIIKKKKGNFSTKSGSQKNIYQSPIVNSLKLKSPKNPMTIRIDLTNPSISNNKTTKKENFSKTKTYSNINPINLKSNVSNINNLNSNISNNISGNLSNNINNNTFDMLEKLKEKDQLISKLQKELLHSQELLNKLQTENFNNFTMKNNNNYNSNNNNTTSFNTNNFNLNNYNTNNSNNTENFNTNYNIYNMNNYNSFYQKSSTSNINIQRELFASSVDREENFTSYYKSPKLKTKFSIPISKNTITSPKVFSLKKNKKINFNWSNSSAGVPFPTHKKMQSNYTMCFSSVSTRNKSHRNCSSYLCSPKHYPMLKKSEQNIRIFLKKPKYSRNEESYEERHKSYNSFSVNSFIEKCEGLKHRAYQILMKYIALSDLLKGKNSEKNEDYREEKESDSIREFRENKSFGAIKKKKLL